MIALCFHFSAIKTKEKPIMNRTLDNIKYAMAMIGIFVFLGFVGSGFWWLFELATGYTEGLFRMAGF